MSLLEPTRQAQAECHSSPELMPGWHASTNNYLFDKRLGLRIRLSGSQEKAYLSGANRSAPPFLLSPAGYGILCRVPPIAQQDLGEVAQFADTGQSALKVVILRVGFGLIIASRRAECRRPAQQAGMRQGCVEKELPTDIKIPNRPSPKVLLGILSYSQLATDRDVAWVCTQELDLFLKPLRKCEIVVVNAGDELAAHLLQTPLKGTGKAQILGVVKDPDSRIPN